MKCSKSAPKMTVRRAGLWTDAPSMLRNYIIGNTPRNICWAMFTRRSPNSASNLTNVGQRWAKLGQDSPDSANSDQIWSSVVQIWSMLTLRGSNRPTVAADMRKSLRTCSRECLFE